MNLFITLYEIGKIEWITQNSFQICNKNKAKLKIAAIKLVKKILKILWLFI